MGQKLIALVDLNSAYCEMERLFRPDLNAEVLCLCQLATRVATGNNNICFLGDTATDICAKILQFFFGLSSC